mgnify:CR=1 FL=1
MIGTLAFSLVMLVFSLVSMWWLNGTLPALVQKYREKAASSKGRVVTFSLGKRQFSFTINREFWVREAFLILGPSAVMGLSVAYAQILPLRVVFALFVLPAYIIMAVLGVLYPEWGKKAAIGFTAGVLATIVYDVVRLGLVIALGVPDPIPHIGTLWLGADTIAHGDMWWVGYLWRFFGNGAGLGIAYAMLPKIFFSLKGGWLYGDFVGMGMFAVLFFFPVAQLHLFILNFTVLVNGILGHWAYGLAIGWIFHKSKLIRQTFTK